MEGKGSVIMGLLILSLVVAIPVDACVDVADASNCPSDHPSISPLINSGDTMIEFCKLGCASSVCNAISTTLPNSDIQVAKKAVENCHNACYKFCTKKQGA